MKTYLLNQGATLRMPDNTLLTGPAEIELPDDIAAMHGTVMRLKPAAQPQAETPAAATGAAA